MLSCPSIRDYCLPEPPVRLVDYSANSRSVYSPNNQSLNVNNNIHYFFEHNNNNYNCILYNITINNKCNVHNIKISS